MSEKPSRFLTADSAAEELGVSKMTIYRLIYNRTLPALRVGRLFRIERAHWEKYLQYSRYPGQEG